MIHGEYRRLSKILEKFVCVIFNEIALVSTQIT
jgi:hypothetical protein